MKKSDFRKVTVSIVSRKEMADIDLKMLTEVTSNIGVFTLENCIEKLTKNEWLKSKSHCEFGREER